MCWPVRLRQQVGGGLTPGSGQVAHRFDQSLHSTNKRRYFQYAVRNTQERILRLLRIGDVTGKGRGLESVIFRVRVGLHTYFHLHFHLSCKKFQRRLYVLGSTWGGQGSVLHKPGPSPFPTPLTATIYPPPALRCAAFHASGLPPTSIPQLQNGVWAGNPWPAPVHSPLHGNNPIATIHDRRPVAALHVV